MINKKYKLSGCKKSPSTPKIPLSYELDAQLRASNHTYMVFNHFSIIIIVFIGVEVLLLKRVDCGH
jgi:hypothetical protein